MAGKAGKELCATMERRGRPDVGRALHWCSNEPVSQCGPGLRGQDSGDGGLFQQTSDPV